MIRHAVRATVAVAALSLAVLGPPVQAQDKPSTQEPTDLRARAESGEADSQFILGWMYATGAGVPQDSVEAVAWYRKAALVHESGVRLRGGRPDRMDEVESPSHVQDTVPRPELGRL